MFRRLLIAIAFLAAALPAAGQAVRYDNILLNQSGKPVVNAEIQVCSGNVTTPVPCSPTTTVYADQALTTPITQPFTTGPLGNYGFWLPTGGTYTISISGPNIPWQNFPITPGGTGGGSLNPPVAANGIQYVTSDGNDANSGTFPDAAHAKATVAAAITAVEAVGGGTVDARGLKTATITSEIDVGDGTHSVTLILPSSGTWTASTISDGTSCFLKVWAGSSIVNFAPSNGGSKFTIQNSGAVNADSMICTQPLTYTRIDAGILLYNPGPTFGTYVNGLLNWNEPVDASVVRGLTTANYNGIGFKANQPCCSAIAEKIVTNGNGQSGAQPFVLTTGTAQATGPVSFSSLSADHAGAGQSEISIVNTTGNLFTANFYNTYVEGNAVAATVPHVDVNTVGGTVNFNGLAVYSRNSSETAYGVQIENNAASMANFEGYNYYGTQASPPILSDLRSGKTINSVVANNSLNYKTSSTILTGTLSAGDATLKGPNPYQDIRAYGAVSGSIHTTGTGTGTALTVGVSTFANGEGIAIAGGGAASTMTDPASGPTVTPGEAEGETVSNVPMAAGAQGTTTYSYTFFAEAQNGSLTAASPAGSTTTGAATLGPQTITLNSLSLTGNTLTIGSATNTGLLQYAILHTKAAANSYYLSGYFPMNTIISGTSASASGLPGYSATAVTAASGTGVYFSGNTLTGLGVTGSLRTWICRGGVIVGVTLPGQTTWTDFGFPAPPIPWYISNANCSAAASTPALAVTTVSAGGGTTGLTLASPLTTAVTGAAVRLDSAPAIIAAANVAAGTSAVLIPKGSSGSFEVNSYTQLRDLTSLVENGTLVLNDTLATGLGLKWSGSLYSGNALLQFSNSNNPQVTCNAYPCINFANSSGTASGISISHLFISGADNDLLMAAYGSVGGWGYNFDTVELFTGNDNNDDAGIGWYAAPNVSQIRFVNALFYAGPNQNHDQTWSPFVYQQGSGSSPPGINLRDVQWNRRGLYLLDNGGGSALLDVTGYSYTQGPITPLYAVEEMGACTCGANINLHGMTTLDTGYDPGLALWGVGPGTEGAGYKIGPTNGPGVDGGGGNPAFVSGGGTSPFDWVAVDQMGYHNNGFLYKNASLQATAGLNAPNLQSALQAPVANTPTLSAGGSVSTGTLNLCVQALGPSGTTSACSNTVSVTVTTGNQTVTITWAASLGATNYNVWVPSGSNSPDSGPIGNVTTYTFSTNLGCCAISPTATYGPLVTQTNGFFSNLGTPQTLVLANATGLPFATGVTGLPALCTGGQFSQGVSASSNNCATPSGSGTVNSGTQFALGEYATAGTALSTGPTPPSTNGVYSLIYNVNAGTAVAPSVAQMVASGRSITGATTTDTVAATDFGTIVTHDQAATGTVTITLPTATTLNNPAFWYKYCNHSPQTDTLIPTTWTIQTGSAAAGASQAIASGVCLTVTPDKNSATQWHGDLTNAGGSGGFAGTVTYTAAQTAGTSDNGKLVVLNCSSACAYTLPATQPSTTWQAWVISVGSTLATVTLGGADTFNGSTTAPLLLTNRVLFVAANTQTSTDYKGDAPLDFLSSANTVSRGTATSTTAAGAMKYTSNGRTTIGSANGNSMGFTSGYDISQNVVGNSSGTVTVRCDLGTVQDYTLTAAVTGQTFTNCVNGSVLVFTIRQGATGFAWTWAASVKGGMTVSTTANSVNVQEFYFDGTNYQAINAGVTH